MNVENTNKQKVTHTKRSEANSKQIRSVTADKPLTDHSKASKYIQYQWLTNQKVDNISLFSKYK